MQETGNSYALMASGCLSRYILQLSMIERGSGPESLRRRLLSNVGLYGCWTYSLNSTVVGACLTLGLRVMRSLVDDPFQAKLFLFPPLIDMADQRPPRTAKDSKGFLNRLKKVFGPGSQSTPAIVASPPTVAAPPAGPSSSRSFASS